MPDWQEVFSLFLKPASWHALILPTIGTYARVSIGLSLLCISASSLARLRSLIVYSVLVHGALYRSKWVAVRVSIVAENIIVDKPKNNKPSGGQ